MASRPCGREAETTAAAWTGAFAPDLAAHLGQCEDCREIAALAQALRDDRSAACTAARPPSAGAVWWRAQRRAREEAARRAARPIAFVHGIALGCGVAAVVAILGLGFGGLRAFLPSWPAFAWPALPSGSAVALLGTLPTGVLVVLAATLLLAPVAVYLAVAEK
jgi:predicted anti-sigma-YlaC factor YlaD